MAKKGVMLVRRDTGEKTFSPEANLAERCKELLAEIQRSLHSKAQQAMKLQITAVKTIEEAKAPITDGRFARLAWCGEIKCAASMEKFVDAHFIGYECDEVPKAGEVCACRCAECKTKAKYFGYVGKTY
jgi:prolyl-tRNA synthetase